MSHWRALQPLLLTLGLTSIGACSDVLDVPSPTQASLRKDVAIATSPVRTLDDDFAALSAEVPGFGGLFFEGERLNVFLTDPSSAGGVAGRIAQFIDLKGGRGRGGQSAAGMRVLRGDFSYADLVTWYRALLTARFSSAVVSTDIDESKNRIVIGVSDLAATPAISAAAQALSVPLAAVVVVKEEPAVAMATLQDYYRPLYGGLQIGGGTGICTLSFVAFRRVGIWGDAVDSSTAYFVTNSHCTPEVGVRDQGYEVGQPSMANVIGVEVVDPPLFTNAANSACPPGRSCRYSDAALFWLYFEPNGFWHGTVASSYPSSNPLDHVNNYSIIDSHDQNAAFIGSAVFKVGRTTGETSGVLTRTCVNFNQSRRLPDGTIVDTGRTFLCQNETSMVPQPGDSGSPVLYSVSNPNYYRPAALVGVLWGGSTRSIYSRWGYVSSEICSDTFWEPWTCSGLQVDRTP